MIIQKNQIATIIRLSRQAFGHYKWQIVGLTSLGFLSAILEGIGVNALIPLFSFALGEGEGGQDIISQAIESSFGFFNIDFSVKFLLIFIVTLFIFKALTFVLVTFIKVRMTTEYEARTRASLLEKVLKANWSHLLKQKLGHLENILMVDVRSCTTLLDEITSSIIILTSLSIYILVAINISAWFTFWTILVALALFLVFKPLVNQSKKFAARTEKTNKSIAHHINENVLGIKTVKTMMVDDQVVAKGKEYFYRLKKLSVNLFMLKTVTGAIIQPIGVIFIGLIFIFSYQSPTFNFAALVALIYLVQKIFTYIQQLQKSLHIIYERAPYLMSVYGYQAEVVKSAEVNGGQDQFRFNQNLEFKDVDFAYDANRPVLSQINFTIAKGQMTGLIGPSGVGKTTLVDLILRLFNPVRGQILLDGEDISKIDLNSWRKNIGYVSQDIFLINDTIGQNIRFYDDSITAKQIEQAAKMANIYDFIASQPEKFDTVIGDRGILLSAGQRQRIVIARILARQPQLLILDEATSALDNESEIQIQQVIKNLKGKVTVLAIAHRLSTVMDSDKLIVLEKGRIVEQGDPKKLLADQKTYFYKVYNLRK